MLQTYAATVWDGIANTLGQLNSVLVNAVTPAAQGVAEETSARSFDLGPVGTQDMELGGDFGVSVDWEGISASGSVSCGILGDHCFTN